MNKKQLIVAWVTGFFIFVEWLLILLYNYKIIQHHFLDYLVGSGAPTLSPMHNFIFLSMPAIIFGILLIYTLRDREE